MQLIPAIAMVRFHRLLRLASNRRSPTRKDHRFESGTLHSHGALLQVRHFSFQEKDESHRGFSTRTRTIFRCASRSTWFSALNERSPTRKQAGSNPARSTKRVVRRWNGIFPVKEKTFGSFCGFDTRAQSVFSRGASGEAMTLRGGSARSPFV